MHIYTHTHTHSHTHAHGDSIVCGYTNGVIQVWSIYDLRLSAVRNVFTAWASMGPSRRHLSATPQDIYKDTYKDTFCLSPNKFNGNVHVEGANAGHGGGCSGGGGEAKRAVGRGGVPVVVGGGVGKLPRLEINHHYGSVSVFCSPA
jgi:hypothetical protein